MSKTLSTILTIFKIAKIVAKVIFILCIVGGAGCLLGLSTLPIIGSILPPHILIEEGLNLPSAYFACIVGAISCAGETVLAFFAERYFGSVLNAGTPFTLEGAKESFRLGIISIIVSVATSIASGLALVIFMLASVNVTGDFDSSISLSMGLFFLFISLIFKHGSELRKSADETAKQEEQTFETEAL